MTRGVPFRVDGIGYVNQGAGRPRGEQCPTCGSRDRERRQRVAVSKDGPDPEQRHGYSPATYMRCGNDWHLPE